MNTILITIFLKNMLSMKNEVLKKEKHTFWLIRILFKVKKFIKLVVDFGSFTRDDLKTEPRIKKYSSDLELVRCNFKSYLVNKRKSNYRL